MRTLKLTLSYDGTDYAGWQRQAGAPTIQAHLEEALGEIEGRPVTAHGAGRTDAGVHALGQVASVRLSHPIEAAALARALNAKLPPDIRVVTAIVAADRFHARYDACAKTYRYRMDVGPVANPLDRRFAWHLGRALDLDRMREAGARLLGTHDFAAFQTAAGKGSPRSTVRTLTRLAIDVPPPVPEGSATGPLVTCEIVGDGFLRHMVRTIVGTLVEVGSGRRAVADVESILSSARREQAGPTAPARGLFLVHVDY